MKPTAGYGYLDAAAHIAAESSTGTNVEVCTTDDFTKGVDALVYFIDEAKGVMKVAYPIDLFDRNITDGRVMLVSFLTLAIGNNQGMGDIERQDARLLRAAPVHAPVRRPVQGHHRPVANPRSPASMAATSPAPSSSPSSACVPSRSPRRPTSSGSAATSSRTTNPRATRCSARSRKSSRWSMTP